MQNKKEIETTTIQNIIFLLKHDINQCTAFIKDVTHKRMKDWHIYRQEYSRLIEMNFKGRAIPTHPSKSGGSEHLAKVYNRQKEGISYIQQIRGFRKLTPKQQILKISNSDIDITIKAELISDILKSNKSLLE